MNRIAIQSDLKNYKKAELCYAVMIPYQIFHNTSHGSYFVKKLHEPGSLELKLWLTSCIVFPHLIKLLNLLKLPISDI